MRWIDALKEWNKGSPKWCIPKKGSAEYDAVKEIMGGKKVEPAPAPAPKMKKPAVAPPKMKKPAVAPAPAPKMQKPAVAVKEKESPEMKNAKIRYFESIGDLPDADKRIASMSPTMKKDYEKYLKKPTKPKPLASYAKYS